MMSFSKGTVSIAILLSLAMSISNGQQRDLKGTSDSELARKIKRFSPTVLTADISRLSVGDRKALEKIIEAAKLLDKLFLRQVWSGNEALHQKLEADGSVVGRERLHYFLINDGPWSRLDRNEPLIEGVAPKQTHASY